MLQEGGGSSEDSSGDQMLARQIAHNLIPTGKNQPHVRSTVKLFLWRGLDEKCYSPPRTA